MLEVVPYKLDDIKNELKRKAIDELGISDAEFEGSNISQLVDILAYSNVINNTNFTYGLNEMFITQAINRKNVIKHARQMGYTHKRKISYQYKIKLLAKKSGPLTISKYMTFKSGENDYIYMGEPVTDMYGTYAYIRNLYNEYNNSLSVLDDSRLVPGTIIVTEEQKHFKILENPADLPTPKLLLEPLFNVKEKTEVSVLPVSNLPKIIFYWNGTYDNNTGYRNLINVGTVDTFMVDKEEQVFKIQLSTNDVEFPAFSKDELFTTIKEGDDIDPDNPDLKRLKFTLDTPHPIKYIISVVVTVPVNEGDDPDDPNTPKEDLDIDLSTIEYDEGDKNAKLPQDKIGINEPHTKPDISNLPDNRAKVPLNKTPIKDSVLGGSVKFPDGRTRILSPMCINPDPDDDTKVIVEPQYSSTEETFTELDDDNAVTPKNNNIKAVRLISVTDSSGNKKILENYTILTSDDPEVPDKVKLLDENCLIADNINDPDNPPTIKVDYEYYENLEDAEITVKYSFLDDSLIGAPVDIKYAYDVNADGVLDAPFFFSDLRGENKFHEKNFDPDFNPEGWNGFKAISWEPQTQILTFSIKENENLYVKSDKNYQQIEPKQIHQVLTSPFRNTRFSLSEQVNDTYTLFNPDTCFSSIVNSEIKNEIEIIVKEGTIRRYTTLDSTGNPLNRDLIIKINSDMVKEQHLVLYGPDIENDGIEMFINRTMPDGTIEEKPWYKREYLLAEQSVNDYSFIDLPDPDYEDYINIYTRYSGTGDELKDNYICKLNVLSSKGTKGSTDELIEPTDSEEFVGTMYHPSTLTPHILFVEGADVESTESIRNTAPLFSNTANRAVTKKDYKTICESLAYVSQAQVWGGEDELPVRKLGNVYISVIPYSRPNSFICTDYRYVLDKFDNKELFWPRYQQITGQESYVQERENLTDQNILFNVLDNYKIITLNLNYIKTVYLDYDIEVKILKYKFSKSITETHADIFNSINQFFKREIETYNSTFYMSSLTKEIDKILGDDYGVNIDTSFYIDLFDDKSAPDNGVFRNLTMENLAVDDKGFTGLDDTFIFELPISTPILGMFEENVTDNGKLLYRGKLLTDNLTVCDTDNFLEDQDRLEVLTDDRLFLSIDKNKNTESNYASSYSSMIEIPIMYKPVGCTEKYGYKVGTYKFYNSHKIIIISLYTKHYSSKFYIGNSPRMSYNDMFKHTDNYTETQVGYENLHTLKTVSLPRQEFYKTIRSLKISPKDNNISNIKNVFSRLRSVNFKID